ncbi:MAG TPA: YetF domain-containing protein [Actinomycetota bacterium]|jgi:uncharacterized membrane protein YcaP (DUF421 family)
MWHNLVSIGSSWQERAVRAIVVYVFLLVLFRVFGRRELGQLTGFDIIVLLTISNILQNSMIGNDNSVIGGMIGAAVLLAANLTLAYVVFRSRRAERLIEGGPKILIQDGKLQETQVSSELLTEQDLISAVHREGLESFDDVHLAIAEPNGMISIIPRARSDRATED